MSIRDVCGCPPSRALGTPHIPPCQLAEPTAGEDGQPEATVLVLRNPDTQRPVAIPDEVVSAAEREYRAYKAFRLEGKTWTEIAEQEGYESPAAAAAAVRRYLDEAVAVLKDFSREQIIADYVGRLDYYRAKLMPEIEKGKTAAIATALSVEDRWVKAYGLDQVTGEDATEQTVVVASPEYIAELQAAAEEAESAAS